MGISAQNFHLLIQEFLGVPGIHELFISNSTLTL
jgi:hypothetical protein